MNPTLHSRDRKQKRPVRATLQHSALLLVAVSALVGLTGFLPGSSAYAQCPLNCPALDGSGLSPLPPNRTPDIDGNGIVNLPDLATFALSFPPGPYAMCCDMDCDGIVNLIDLAIFAIHYSHFGPQLGVCN